VGGKGNQSHLAVSVGNELVGKAMVGLTNVELRDGQQMRRLTVENLLRLKSYQLENVVCKIENLSSRMHRDR